MTGTALVPRKRQAVTVTKAEHLKQAKRDLAEYEKLLYPAVKALWHAAEHIAAALDQGATQREVAKAMRKSQSWVNAFMAWHKRGGTGAGPFAIASKEKRKRIAARLDQAPDQMVDKDGPIPKVQPNMSTRDRARFAGTRDRAAELGCTLRRKHPWFYLTSDQGTERHKTIEQVQHSLDIIEEVERDRKECVALNQKVIEAEHARAEFEDDSAKPNDEPARVTGSVERPIERVKEAGAALATEDKGRQAFLDKATKVFELAYGNHLDAPPDKEVMIAAMLASAAWVTIVNVLEASYEAAGHSVDDVRKAAVAAFKAVDKALIDSVKRKANSK
jgi:hypothetical protein